MGALKLGHKCSKEDDGIGSFNLIKEGGVPKRHLLEMKARVFQRPTELPTNFTIK